MWVPRPAKNRFVGAASPQTRKEGARYDKHDAPPASRGRWATGASSTVSPDTASGVLVVQMRKSSKVVGRPVVRQQPLIPRHHLRTSQSRYSQGQPTRKLCTASTVLRNIDRAVRGTSYCRRCIHNSCTKATTSKHVPTTATVLRETDRRSIRRL